MRFFESIKQNFPKDWATRIFLALVLVGSLVGAYFAHNLVSRLLAGTTALPCREIRWFQPPRNLAWKPSPPAAL